jgi:hypothetical protein
VFVEIMKPSREISIFLLLALGLTLGSTIGSSMVSSPLGVAFDVVAGTDVVPCEPSPCGSDSEQGTDDCCDTSCQLCNHPCCSGTAMISMLSQVLDSSLTSNGRLVGAATDVMWVDSDPLYHPPRS